MKKRHNVFPLLPPNPSLSKRLTPMKLKQPKYGRKPHREGNVCLFFPHRENTGFFIFPLNRNFSAKLADRSVITHRPPPIAMQKDKFKKGKRKKNADSKLLT
ncbi:hypothetical protein AAHE18_13G225300 [Arachis hypogaea]